MLSRKVWPTRKIVSAFYRHKKSFSKTGVLLFPFREELESGRVVLVESVSCRGYYRDASRKRKFVSAKVANG